MSCGSKNKIPFADGESETYTLTLGHVRSCAKEFTHYRFHHGLFRLIPEAFKLRGLKNRFDHAMEYRRDVNNERFVRRVLRMAEEGKSTFAIPDDVQVSFTAGHLRKCATKMCSDWRKGLEMLFPEAFERVRIYPHLVDGCFVKDKLGEPHIIKMDDDGSWKYINLKTAKVGNWMRIHEFEALLVENECVIIPKEEACALI